MAQRVPATPVIFLYVKDHDKKIWSWKFYCARTITFQYIWRKPEFTPERLLNQAVLARDQPWRHGVNVAILVKRKQCDFSPLWTIISRWKRPIMDFKVCVHWNVTIFWYFVTFPLIWTLFLPTIVPWTMAEDTPTTQSRGVKRCVAWGCNKTYKNSEVSLHSFPFDRPEILRQWTNFARTSRKNWNGPSKYSVLCSDHFDADAYPAKYRIMETVGQIVHAKTLNKDAVPTKPSKNQPQQENEDVKTDKL